MAVRTVNLYCSATSTTEGTIYFNTSTAAWYADADCQTQITKVTVPRRTQYAFQGYRIGTSSTSTLYIDADGNIVYTPTWTSSGTSTLYSRWTQVSRLFSIDPNYSESTTYTWTPRTTAFYRSTAADTHFYSDDLLTNEITKISLPYESGKSCAGIYTTNSDTGVRTYYVNPDGTFNTSSGIATSTSTTEWKLAPSVRMWTCYKMTLNANGGTGGPTDPVWWDRVRDKWCADDIMSQQITRITSLPTRSGYIFKGYYTATSGGTQVIDADGTLLTYSAVESANKTVYAQWATPVTITVSHGGGTGSFTNLYYGGGRFYTSSELTEAVTSVTIPTLANHRFLGYYSGSTQVIDASGNISGSWSPTAAVTITASWERVSYTINIETNGGGGLTALYANAAKTAVYADEMCSGSALASITPLTRAGYRFMGIYASNDVSGTQLIDATGNFTSSWSSFLSSITDTVTVYALWQQVFTIELDAGGGEGAPGEIYYDDAYCQFYDNAAMSTPVSSITVPTKECYRFDGFYSAASGGTQLITAAGAISGSWTPTESCTIYAQWSRRSYKYTLDPNGGTTTQAAIYNNGSSGTYYKDDALTTVATSVALPTYPGYTFGGYANGGTSVVDASGQVVISSAITADTTATAAWTANTYTLYFDYNGGSGTVASKQVTFGQAIGSLPTATRTRAIFAGWVVNGESAGASTVYNVPSDTTAQAQWNLQFGGVTDWFSLGNANGSLRPISSNSGDNRQRICVMHTGQIEPNVGETSGVWRNPTVTYQVVRDMTLAVTLGRAYAAASGISGYMITGVQVNTSVGNFPTVTVSATANEGANAINTFPLSLSIKGRARAQNLLNAVSGGGQLQSCRLQASCTPVVIAENNMPCASDVVGGKLIVTASTYAPNAESAPTAGGNFTEVGAPKQCGDKDYLMWQFKAERDM